MLLAALLVGLVACAGSSAGHPASAASRAGATAPCGWRATGPATYDHVVWIILENHSYEDLVAAKAAPYLNRLARSCGLATNAWSVTHPSLPNYLALVSGSTGGVTNDCGPTSCPQRRSTLFSQVQQAGGSWRVLAEGMPAACSRQDSTPYVARHNPATYFPAIATACARWDLPMGTPSKGRLASMVAGGRLPSFLLVVPDQCHNTHDCPIGTGDAWLSTVVPLLTGGPDYRAGRTAVVITWDEGAGGHDGENCRTDRSRSCHIVTVVVSPSTKPGTRSAARYDPYAVLKTTERLLGIRVLLGHAADPGTRSMRSALGL